MPEGPEVKLFVDKIKTHFINKKLSGINVLSGRYLKKPIENLSSIINKNLDEISCKGKFIWFNFEGIIAFNTLGMTGSWGKNKQKHARIEMSFQDGSKLYFTDIRNFGTFQIKSKEDLYKKLKSIGPDMLSNPPSNFSEIMRKYNHKNICEVLMNQKIISGVGNYIKAECLWFSKINPNAKIENLKDNDLKTLEKAILFVMKRSYSSLGASFKTYYTFEGEKGSATERFAVYNKKIDICGNVVLKEETKDKRVTHWSPKRQTIGI